MAMTNQQARPPLTPAESYNAAVQLHNQEFRTLGERNNAFLIAQSILVVALVTLLTYQHLFPLALEFFIWGISIVGSLFCLFHHLAGRSGSQAAFRWRQYMSLLETGQTDTPWKQFYEYCEDEHKKHGKARIKNLWTRLQCDRCLLERSPLPTAWITTPAIFAAIWVFVSSYITKRLFMPDDPLLLDLLLCVEATRAISVIVAVITFLILCYIVYHCVVWWKTRRN